MYWGAWYNADTFSVAVTKEDVRGTALIVVAVILILIFSSINHGLDGSISLERYVLGHENANAQGENGIRVDLLIAPRVMLFFDP
jgi:hypothetical protein